MTALYEKMSSKLELDYYCLVEYSLDNMKDVFLGHYGKPRKCRFCGRTEPEANFTKVAHAVPHFIGNRTLKSNYECNDCNEKVFAPMESHFCRFMGLFHVLSHVSRGGKVPSFKINSTDNGRIDVGAEWTDVHCVENENISFDIDREKKQITIKATRSYVPIEVYKCVIKMAISIMPEEEMNHLKLTLLWLMSKGIALPHLYLSVRIYESLMPFNGKCVIYKRKANHTNNVPCYLFGLSYYNLFIQTYLPLCDEDKSQNGNVTMPFIPNENDKEGFRYNNYDYDLSSTKKVFNEKVSMTFDFDHLNEL